MRLNRARLKALNEVILILQGEQIGPNPVEFIVEMLWRLMPSSWFSADYVYPTTGRIAHQVGRNLEGIANVTDGVAQFGHENPIVRHVHEAGLCPALRMSQFTTFRQFAQTGYYAEVLRHLTGFRDQAAVLVSLPTHTVGFTLNRESLYTAEDGFTLELLQPHLKLVLRRSSQYATLPAQTPLTSREREVLHWLAQGKRDSEISVILGVSERTVSQHVRAIPQKLAVENRTAAAAVAWRARLGQTDPLKTDQSVPRSC